MNINWKSMYKEILIRNSGLNYIVSDPFENMIGGFPIILFENDNYIYYLSGQNAYLPSKMRRWKNWDEILINKNDLLKENFIYKDIYINLFQIYVTKKNNLSRYLSNQFNFTLTKNDFKDELWNKLIYNTIKKLINNSNPQILLFEISRNKKQKYHSLLLFADKNVLKKFYLNSATKDNYEDIIDLAFNKFENLQNLLKTTKVKNHLKNLKKY